MDVSDDGEFETHTVSTPQAVLRVARQGRQAGPVIITFHDLGLNHLTNFKVRSDQTRVSAS